MFKVHYVSKDTYVFHCPGCKENHRLDKRWSFNGDNNKPTFYPSVLYDAPPVKCHSEIKDGKITFHLDSTHDLKGKTVDLPNWYS